MAEYLKPRRSKYGVRNDEEGKRQRTYGGVLYHSRAEMRYAQELDVMKFHGQIREWKRQVRFPLVVNGVSLGHYVADFEVFENEGKHALVGRLIDVKGMDTAASKLKRKLVLALYGREVEIVKR